MATPSADAYSESAVRPAVEPRLARKGLRRWTVALVIAPLLVFALIAWGAIDLGRWLVVEDPLEPARAVVVLAGHVPFRALEAARIYQRGLVGEVWLTRAAPPLEEAKLDEMGIPFVREETYNREVLERMGVPKSSICLLDDPARNTADEVLAVARRLKQTGAVRVILVTSKPHTRRVKATWRALAGDTLEAEVHGAGDPYRADRWWRNTGDALAVSREFFGLLNVWAGFPVRPDRGP